jgi:hypothetical protein
LPDAQSVSALQAVLQVLFVSQTNRPPQVVGVGVPQAPAPVQVGAGVNVTPVQVALPHTTLVAACMQAPAPLQVPVFPQVPLGPHRACGSVTPLPTLEQVPAPFRLQAWQVPQDGL